MENKNSNEIYIRVNESIKLKASEIIYIGILSIYLIIAMINTTMFNVYITDRINIITKIVSFGIIFKIILFDKYSVKKIYIAIIIGVFSITSYLNSGYSSVLNMALFIIGAKNIDFRKICKVYLIIGITITIIAFIGVKLNIIEHIIYFREGKPRYSFGSVYTTDFAARIFFLCTAYCYIKNKKLNILDSIMFIIITVLIIHFCDARVDAISIILLSILPIIMKMYNKKNKYGKILTYLIAAFIPAISVISIVITNLYTPSNNILYILNKILTGRLDLGKKGIEIYGISLFGKNIPMQGNGGINGNVSNYFFIDCSYLHIALRYGILLLFIMVILYFIFIKNRMKQGDLLLPILIIIIGINSAIAHHFLDIAYNPFVLVFLSNTYDIKIKKICKYA